MFIASPHKPNEVGYSMNIFDYESNPKENLEP